MIDLGIGGSGGEGSNTGGNSNNMTRRYYKRQSSTVFLNIDGASNAQNCSMASSLSLTDNELSFGSQMISTDPGVAFQLFQGSPVVLSITRTFLVINGSLQWQSPFFAGGQAIFCIVPSGQIYVEFQGPTDPAYPANCTAIQLGAIPCEFSFRPKL
jgi:hypothetical protein